MDLDKVGREPRWVKRLPSPVARKALTGIAGGLLLAGGFAITPVPGPWSIPLILAGVTVLSWEYRWAKRARQWVLTRLRDLRERRRDRRRRKGERRTGDGRGHDSDRRVA